MKPKTVDEYIESCPEGQRDKLIEMRKIIRTALSDTSEVLKWGAPATIDKDGMILFIFSEHKQHLNLVATPSTREAFHSELGGYETGEGSVKLSYDKPLSAELVKKIVLFRAKEYRKNGVKWK